MELVKQAQAEATVAISPIRIKELIEAFINDKDVKPSSKRLYRRTLKQYFKWIERTGYDLNEVARANILEYKDSLFNKGLSSLTIGSYITSVRSFYEWLEANKLYANVAKGIKTPSRTQQFRKKPLTAKQAGALLLHYEGEDPRNFAIINLLLRTGLRTIEVTRANVEDITFNGSKRVLMVHGKGRHEKDNFVILTDKAYKPIEAYLSQRGRTNTSEPLFTSSSNRNSGGRLTTRTISYLAKEGLKAIGLDAKQFTAHSLRHTAAVNMLKAGGTLEMVQYALRHTNPATTQIYTASVEEARRLDNSGEDLLDNMF